MGSFSHRKTTIALSVDNHPRFSYLPSFFRHCDRGQYVCVCLNQGLDGRWRPSAQEKQNRLSLNGTKRVHLCQPTKTPKQKALLILLSIHSLRRGQVDEVANRFQY